MPTLEEYGTNLTTQATEVRRLLVGACWFRFMVWVSTLEENGTHLTTQASEVWRPPGRLLAQDGWSMTACAAALQAKPVALPVQ